MIHKTKGICLHTLKYGETSVIATIYTEELGRQSYMIKGARGKKAKIKANMLQPLFMVDMEVANKPGRELQQLRELKSDFVYSSIPFDIMKNTQALFIAEFLFRSLRHEDPDSKLFQFISNSLKLFDLSEEGSANFTLFFLIELAGYLGIDLKSGNINGNYFDMEEVCFVNNEPNHPLFLNRQLTNCLKTFFSGSILNLSEINVSNGERRALFDKITQFFHLHIDGIGEIKSKKVLQEVFS
ncbi:DNA repair protein RecO [Prolixibacteraceae bacterium JC049]|nr:DNA repair protein RecO [Prolixibacteraceae bacterium JC049]